MQITIWILWLLPLFSCKESPIGNPAFSIFKQNQTQKSITYKNIIILSDLSDRLEKKPNKDIEEIKTITDEFYKFVNPRVKIGDKSCLLFTTFSEKEIKKIDLSSIVKTTDRQHFINSTGACKGKGFKEALMDLHVKIKATYNDTKKRNKGGLDLISLLVDKIENESILKPDQAGHFPIYYDHHIYIFTDGYLEYTLKNSNNQFRFGNKEIEKLRKYCTQKNISIQQALKEMPSLGLPAVKRANHKRVSLHIMETHSHDKDDGTLSYKNPIGKRDNEILKAVWSKWAIESGFKAIEWNTY